MRSLLIPKSTKVNGGVIVQSAPESLSGPLSGTHVTNGFLSVTVFGFVFWGAIDSVFMRSLWEEWYVNGEEVW